MPESKPFCTVPFVRAFVLPDGRFRNCCATDPQIISKTTDWDEWWNRTNEFNEFRNKCSRGSFPSECAGCAIQEKNTGHSFRVAVNKENPIINPISPKEWSIMFGNKCNLACWTCTEDFSSRIESEKRILNILPIDYKSSNALFDDKWDALKEKIIDSYNDHEIITLSILGGEPTYNNTVIDFLNWLYEHGFSKRTKLEITTNGTKIKEKLIDILKKDYWSNIYIAVSVDTIGKKAEWLRYGCKWDDVVESIKFYKENANYVELHCTLSILNILDLPNLKEFSEINELNLIIFQLNQPSFMAITAWDGDAILFDRVRYSKYNLEGYVDAIGESPINGSQNQLKDYINTMGVNRSKLVEYDQTLFNILFTDKTD